MAVSSDAENPQGATQLQIIVEVPENARPGVTKLAVDVDEESELHVLVPAEAAVGDRLRLSKMPDGPWTCVVLRKQPLHDLANRIAEQPGEDLNKLQLLVPAAVKPGLTKLQVSLSAGEQVQLSVPEYASPGDLIELERAAGEEAWQAKFTPDQYLNGEDAGKNLAVMADLGKVSRDATLDLEAAVEHLFKVAKEAGCFVSPKIKRGCAPPLYIPGLLAAEDIQEGEELLRIPAHLHLTPPAVEAAAPALAAVAKKSAMPDHRRSEALHSFFLARLLADSQERALDKAAEGKSILRSYWTASEAQQKVWEAYADTLLGEDFAYHPFRLAAFNPGGTREAMRPSQEAEYFIEMATDLMMLHESMVRCGQEAGVPDSVEAEMFLRARLCSQTRVFQTCVDTTLVPVADLLNHSPTLTPGVLWAWDGEAQCMVITAVRAHRSGEELFTTYGSRSNMLLYRTYGFTLHPKEEPSFTYIIRPHIVRPVMKVFWGHEEAKPLMLLESSHIDDSLCKVLNSVAKRGKDATEFLRLICARSRWPYERQEQLRPLLDALARARQIDPAAHNWWAYVNPEHQHCIEQDSFRVIMSEYLCLTAHLEVVDFADGRISEAQCLRCCQTWRLSLAKALGLLRTSGGFTLTTVNGDASKRWRRKP